VGVPVEEEISLTGRVLLSTANDESARGSTRTAEGVGKSRKVDENAEDLHVDNHEVVCVY
jgi:hypothetical protein